MHATLHRREAVRDLFASPGTEHEKEASPGHVAPFLADREADRGRARLFVARGAKGIAICGRNAEKGKAVANDLAKAGAKVEYVKADLADLNQARTVIAAADKAFGRVDILVNAAGITMVSTISRSVCSSMSMSFT